MLALACDIGLFSQAHDRSRSEPETQPDPLWKNVFRFHWKEASQHAVLDEMAWLRGNATLGVWVKRTTRSSAPAATAG